MRYCLLACILGLFLFSQAYAEVVCAVHDGDTLRLCNNQRIRIWGVDSPELSQPYGTNARDFLSALVMGQDVRLHCVGRSYNRQVCSITFGPLGSDIGQALVAAGYAYDYYRYSGGYYAFTEWTAQQHHEGLWHDPGLQQKPWDYRQAKKAAAKARHL